MRYENFHISVFHPPKQQGFESTPRRNLSIVRECKIKFANLLTHPALSPIYQYRWRIMVEEGGFEPPKRNATDLQSAPFGRSGTLPLEVRIARFALLDGSVLRTFALLALHAFCFLLWSWWTDSNPRPADYKSAALPTELHQHQAVRPTAKVILPEKTPLVNR